MIPRLLLLILVAGRLAAGDAAPGEPPVIARAAAAAARVAALRLAFTQEKRLEMLDEPLRSSGTIEIDRAHGRLRWQFERGPVLILAHGHLRRWGPDGKAEGLRDDPSLQAMQGQMQALVSGDWGVMRELFAIRAGADADEAVLVPRGTGLAAFVERIEVAFRPDGSPRTLLLVAAGGDRTAYAFTEPEAAWRPDPVRFLGP